MISSKRLSNLNIIDFQSNRSNIPLFAFPVGIEKKGGGFSHTIKNEISVE